MRWSSLASEAWRNVVSGTALTLQLAALLGALCVALVALGSSDLLAITQQGEHFRGAGADVLIIRAEGRIDPAACEALNGTAGVQAGALRQAATNLVAAALPDSSIPTYDITQGLAALLGVTVARDGVLLSRQAADTLGASPGAVGAAAVGAHALGAYAGGAEVAEAELVEVRVAGVYEYPDDGRRTDLEFAVLAPTTSREPFDECWARTWPPSDGLETLLRTTQLQAGAGANDAELLQLNGTLGATFDGEALFNDRPTRLLPLFAAVAGLIVGFVATRLRRIELASARHSGVSLADQWLTTVGESVPWVVAVFALCAPVTLGFAGGADTASYLAIGTGIPALASVGALAGMTAAVILSGEAGLFRHVKQRR